jgi:hypothetical protein
MDNLNNQFPNVSFNSGQLPDIKDWEVNGVYKLEITVQMTGVRKAESYDLPTQIIGEGTMPENSMMIGQFQIIDAEVCEDSVEKEYENEYADRMESVNQVYKDDKVTITINKN